MRDSSANIGIYVQEIEHIEWARNAKEQKLA